MEELTFYLGLAERIHASLNSRTSAAVVEILQSGEYGRLKDLKVDPTHHDTALSYFKEAIPIAYLKKAVDLPGYGPEVRRSAALQKWIEAEQTCYRTNLRLRRFIDNGSGSSEPLSDVDRDVSRHLAGIRKIVRSWLGKRPPAAVELGFTPGSTVSDRGHRSTIAHKIQMCPTATIELDDAGYPHFIGTMWHHNMVDAQLTPSLVKGEELFFVDKEFTIDRVAGFQPSLNVSIQSGHGRSIKHRLRTRTGWDISKASEIHKRIACESSLSREFATLDLSSASDTIAITLVKLLLPADWFEALNGCRVHYTAIKKEFLPSVEQKSTSNGEFLNFRLEKFSSMGNGFTFELETVLFAAIACYVTRQAGFPGLLGEDVFVFGDDIIVRDQLYVNLETLLRFLGFTVNLKKSFTGSVPFRESCGGDYFNGVNVRGFYWKKKMDFSPEKLIRLANQIKHASERLQSLNCALDLNGAWFHVLDRIPKRLRDIRGPTWLGDTVLYDPMQLTWKTRVRTQVYRNRGSDGEYDGTRTYQQVREILTLVPVVEYVPWHIFDPATILCCAVLRRGDGERGLVPRQTIRSYKQVWTTLTVLG